ncbi:MAG: phosphotransferase [Planctomycetaceae bacterium]|nr:phosphotransferase [Planctomycetales bacterium]MCB9920581.1 phosphotransferase [Planctomycetaceae bacterium]
MQLIDPLNAEAYLRRRKIIAHDQPVSIHELPGGVSNLVLYVACPTETDFVIKQAREQLRVAAPWFCGVGRIWRELETMQVCTRLLADSTTQPLIPASTPEILFSDRDNFLFGMSAVADHVTWKQQLLCGQVDPDVARACGWLMGRLHGGTWGGRQLPESLHDRTFFTDLRVDPYYRQIATVHPELLFVVERLIRSLDDSVCCLVHGDFSPKNLLVHERGITLVDFEVGHFGDPAFDIGFFLSHLALKAIHAGRCFSEYATLIECFFDNYRTELTRLAPVDEMESVESRAATNLAACLLARVDGKSPVDYLGESTRVLVRETARELLLESPPSVDAVVSALHAAIQGELSP